MSSFLKTYRMSIKTITPLHIGSGDRLSALVDFVRKDSKMIVIDQERLLQWIARQPDAQRLAEILTQSFANPQKGITDFLSNAAIQSRLDLDAIQAYTLPYSGKPREVLTFIKDSLNRPYLPGSSLKGAMRSALLRSAVLTNKALQDFAKQKLLDSISNKRTPSPNIEAHLFAPAAKSLNKVSYYDLNRLLTLRDSLPLSSQNLRVATVKVLSVAQPDGLKSKQTHYGGEMEIFAEMLTAEQIETEVVLQGHLLDKLAASLDFQRAKELIIRLPEHCRITARNLLSQESEFYQRHGHKHLAAWFTQQLDRLSKLPEDTFYLCVGWGGGYDAKTITDLMGESVFKSVVNTFSNVKGLGKPGNNKNAPWLGAADSPKSRKLVVMGDMLLPPGWLEIRLVGWNGNDWWNQERSRAASIKPVTRVEPAPPRDSKENKGASLPSIKQAKSGLSLPPENTSAPTSRPLITKFSQLPTVGDRFQGIVFDTDERGILLEIPGLDPDEVAYALLSYEHNPPLPKTKSGQTILCEVLSLREEQKGYWCVICRLG